jgi:hypothetical protein
MFMPREKNVGQSRNKSIVNKSYENVAEFAYLGKTLTTENVILEGIKNRLKSGNVCYQSVKNLLSYR